VPAALFVVPLGAALRWGVARRVDRDAWSRLCADSQFVPRCGSACGSARRSTLLRAARCGIVHALHGTRGWRACRPRSPALLAVPHAAFAIGLALLLMPSGLVARLVAPWPAGRRRPTSRRCRTRGASR
jgi:putative thiamine transport system permease protein